MLVKYCLAWFGLMIIALLNGGIRDQLYKPLIGELAAHQLSTLFLLSLFGGYFWLLTSKWRIESSRQACLVGIMWLVMTLAFEVGLGRWGLGYTWDRIFHDYNLLAGRVWLLVPAWTLAGPSVFFRLRRKPGRQRGNA